jgi:hypothetical protein
MSNNSVISKKSLSTLNEIKEREYDSLPFRVNFIKTLLEGKEVKPMVEFDMTDTEYFMSKNVKENSNSDDPNSDSLNSNDTRMTLRKKIYNFNKVISQIGGKLMYIKSGTTGHTFKGKIPIEGSDDEFNYAVKIVAYPKKEKYGDIYDSSRPENAELMMLKLLSYFVVKKQTPHIVLPIGTFNSNIKQFVNLAKDGYIEQDNKRYSDFIERYNKNEYFDEVSILISEWANRGDLLDFIKRHYKKFTPIYWKVIFFQILSTLAVIQSKFPSFRHNDMKANNILIHKISKKKTKDFTYTVVKQSYRVPNIQYQIKLWDFDFACIPGIVNNSKVESEWTKAINVTPNRNRYYDMHYFFNTLIRKGFFPQILTDEAVPQETKDFVNRIVPKKYQCGKDIHKRGRILINDEYLTPDDVLKSDPYFEEFRKKPNKDIKNNKSEYINNIQTSAQQNSQNQSVIDNILSNIKMDDLKKPKSKKKEKVSELKLEDLLLENF